MGVANEKITTKEINNNLLLATDDEGRTVFHMAVQSGGLELLHTFTLPSLSHIANCCGRYKPI